jgi:hypothetical protein
MLSRDLLRAILEPRTSNLEHPDAVVLRLFRIIAYGHTATHNALMNLMLSVNVTSIYMLQAIRDLLQAAGNSRCLVAYPTSLLFCGVCHDTRRL